MRKIKLLTLFILVSLFAQASSVVSTWNGSLLGDWNVATNWNPATNYPDNGNAGNNYTSFIANATVTLGSNISLDALSLTNATLSGNFTLSIFSLGQTTIAGSNTLSAGTTLSPLGAFTFADSSASLTNHGTLQFNATNNFGSAYSASNATLTNAATGTIRFDPSSSVSVGDFSTSPFLLTNHGTILADNGQSHSLYAPVSNTGLIHVATGTSLSLQKPFVQNAGEVRVENASLSSAFGQTLVFQGGLLRASGTINAPLSLANTALEIGAAQSAASLSLTGNLTLLSGTSVSFDLNGLTPGIGYDSLAVNGGVTLGGDFLFRLSAGFASTLTATNQFTLINATSFTGAFANIASGQRLTSSDYTDSFLLTLTGTALTLSDYARLSAFETFMLAAGVPLDQRAPTADPDGDGTSNLLEFALGLAPLTPDTDGLPLLALINGDLSLTYIRARPADIIYSVQTTTNLATPSSWTTANVTQGTPATDGLTTATIPLGGPARFLRLRVALTP